MRHLVHISIVFLILKNSFVMSCYVSLGIQHEVNTLWTVGIYDLISGLYMNILE